MIQPCELERVALDMVPDIIAFAPIGKLRYDCCIEFLGLLIVCPFIIISLAKDNEINKLDRFEDLDNVLLVDLGHGIGFHGIPNIDPPRLIRLQICYAPIKSCRVSLMLFPVFLVNGNDGLAMPEVV